MTAVNATQATVTPLTVVAANTPMLIHNSSSDDKTLWIVPTEETHDKPAADNVTVYSGFVGTLTDTEIAASDATTNRYALNGKQFVLVKTALEIPANKAWLEVPANSANASALTIVFDGETTGITTTDYTDSTDSTDKAWYDLNGHKLDRKPTRKGLYIHNGKKIVIK